ncbi:TPA: lactonase family protein [Streptococcus suis]
MEKYILGGYTKRTNDGLKYLSFDPVAPEMTLSPTQSHHKNPTWVTLNSDQSMLLAIDSGQDKGGLTLLLKQGDGTFAPVAQAFETKVAGCHITYIDSYRLAYVSNYHEGSIDVYQVAQDKQSLALVDRYFHQGSSVHPNQQSPHVHMTQVSKDGAYLYACDLGTDKVYVYRFKNNGLLDLVSDLSFKPGTGPRHLALHPTHDLLYVIGELANTTTVVKVLADGQLAYDSTVVNVPSEQADDSAGAAIRINASGKQVYVSTRFADVITVFDVDAEGRLSHSQTIPSGGKTPRDFILSQDQTHLLCAHQDNDVLQVFAVSPTDGKLTALDLTITAPECVNIVPILD